MEFDEFQLLLNKELRLGMTLPVMKKLFRSIDMDGQNVLSFEVLLLCTLPQYFK
jgi:hypothetical protein